jgi:hypothetical protein
VVINIGDATPLTVSRQNMEKRLSAHDLTY